MRKSDYQIGRFKDLKIGEEKMRKKILLVNFVLAATMAMNAHATPSTVLWTPATPYIQPYGLVHLTADNYFTIRRGFNKTDTDLPTTIGLTSGVLPLDKLQAELGFDLMEPSANPWYLNAKIGMPEDALFKDSPGWGLGVFGMGTRKSYFAIEEITDGSGSPVLDSSGDPMLTKSFVPGTDFNIGYAVVGKTLPFIGTLSVGGYYGNSDLLVSSNGSKEPGGFIAGWSRTLGEISDKVGLCADYQSGKNVFGAGGAGITVLPAPNVGLIAGVVFFNDIGLNPNGLFTFQVDVDFDAFVPKAERK
jgi:hypothetical protein